MVKKKDSAGNVQVNPLQVEKETVRDLETDEMQKVEGGVGIFTAVCQTLAETCATCAGRTCGNRRPECSPRI